MKKVICINNINQHGKKTQLVVGDVYTASQCSFYPNNWDLSEFPFTPNGERVSYRKYLFAELSDIDETTFERNYQTATI